MVVIFGILAAFFGTTLKMGVNAQSGNQFGGDVNISALLNSFQMGYDKRVRPNYGGKIQLKNYFKQTIIIND
jgi:hypothetical protein